MLRPRRKRRELDGSKRARNIFSSLVSRNGEDRMECLHGDIQTRHESDEFAFTSFKIIST
jgi:hypothetical protein